MWHCGTVIKVALPVPLFEVTESLIIHHQQKCQGLISKPLNAASEGYLVQSVKISASCFPNTCSLFLRSVVRVKTQAYPIRP